MNTQDIINAILAADPSQLREVFATLHKGFAEKAEALYDQNPEENGLLAQPYADISDLCGEASLAFDETENQGAVDEQPVRQEAAPITVTQAIEARAKNPWGGR